MVGQSMLPHGMVQGINKEPPHSITAHTAKL